MCSLVESHVPEFVDGTCERHLLVPSEVSHIQKRELAISKQKTCSAGILRLVRLLLLGVFAKGIGSATVDGLGQNLTVRSNHLNFYPLQGDDVSWLDDHPAIGRCRQIVLPAVLVM